MIVAIIEDGNVNINVYPELEDIEEIKDLFPSATMLELAEMPEQKDGYILKHDGTDFYYEPIEVEPLSEQEQREIDTYLNTCFIADMMTLGV